METKFNMKAWNEVQQQIDIGEKEWILEGLISLLKSEDKDVVGLRQQILKALLIINSRKMIEEQNLKVYKKEREEIEEEWE